MIFNKTVFKKLLKEAYENQGLLVSNDGERYILSGSWWVMSIEDKYFPKAGRAELVRLTGELPIEGECWRTTSLGNQVEIPPEYIRIDDLEFNNTEPFAKTKLVVEWDGGLIRYLKRGNVVVPINEMVSMLIDTSAGEPGEDYEIEGPYSLNNEASSLYFYTNSCSLSITRLEYESEALEQLQKGLANMNLPQTNW